MYSSNCESQKSKLGLIIGIVAGVLVIGGLVLCYFLFWNKSDDGSSKKVASKTIETSTTEEEVNIEVATEEETEDTVELEDTEFDTEEASSEEWIQPDSQIETPDGETSEGSHLDIVNISYSLVLDRDGDGLLELFPTEMANNGTMKSQMKQLVDLANSYDIKFNMSDMEVVSRQDATDEASLTNLENQLSSNYNCNIKIDAAHIITTSGPCTYSAGDATIKFDIATAEIDGEEYLVGFSYNVH